jgi:carbon monoxide dehydrogenase subunit G
MPRIEQSFEVPKSDEVVWRFFEDVPRVAECMPGVELEDETGAGTYRGRMKLKLGPLNASFQGEASVSHDDSNPRSASINAKGVDRKGGSRASAKVRYEVAPVSAGSRVAITADITLQGAMAQFGRTGLIQEVSAQLTKEFAACLEQKLSAETPEAAAEVRSRELGGLSLLVRGVWSWLGRVFRRRNVGS